MKLNVDIKTEDISSLIISALEGGSNYWYMIEKSIKPTKWTYENDNGERYKKTGHHWQVDYPLNLGGGLVISNEKILDEGEKKIQKTLNRKSIAKGLQIMSEKYPSHFGDILADNSDAETADIFLQCCIFGDAIYG